MHGSSLKRAERLSQASGLLWSLVLVACASALLVPLLVLDLGLVLQYLVTPTSRGPEREWVLGPYAGWMFQGVLHRSGLAYLLILVLIGGCLALLNTVALLAFQRLLHKFTLQVAVALRRAIHDQTFVLGPHELLTPARSRPEELFVERVEAVRRGLVRWWDAMPRSVVELVLLLLLALMLNFWLSLLVILLALYIAPMARGWRRQARDRAASHCQQAEELCGELTSALRLAPLAIGYSLEWPPGERFDETLQRHAAALFRAFTSEAPLKPVLFFVSVLSVSLVLLIVGIAHDQSVAGTVLWGTVLLAACFPAVRLLRLREDDSDAEQAAAEIFSYLDRKPAVIQLPDARPLQRVTRDIRLDKVTIANRDGHRLLDNVSLTIPAGKVAAIVATDCQTPLAIAGLFVRFYDPAAGRILYDDQDIGHATMETVRGQAVLVAADGPLFPGTLTENVACGRSGFTALQIADAVRQAEAEDIVRSLPEGLATRLGNRDGRLNADQAFRLGLARALLREPSVLVVQEPASVADEAAGQQIDAALRHAAQGRTLVVLASRLATLRWADGIFLFDAGRLQAQGKHADLLQSSELYRHLNYIRFNPFRDKVCE